MYGRPDATEDEMLEAAKATFVDRFVHSLPDGYDTMIDDEGSNVSAGEKQLITIARAFLADPALLILDEATSSVDTRTEALLQHAMAALRTDRTSFVIAHRLSTIRDADLILVMENGRIVQQGTHSELLERGGAYADLYNSQFTGAEHDDEPVPMMAFPGGYRPPRLRGARSQRAEVGPATPSALLCCLVPSVVSSLAGSGVDGPKRHAVAQFGALHFGRPEVDPLEDADLDRVTTTWVKRLYSRITPVTRFCTLRSVWLLPKKPAVCM